MTRKSTPLSAPMSCSTQMFGMLQRRDGLRFALEALLHLRVGDPMRRQHFDRDGARQTRVGGFVDLAHAAGADGSDDFVRAEASTGLAPCVHQASFSAEVEGLISRPS